MDEFKYQLFYEGQVYIKPMLCADGKYRWVVCSFEDIKEDTPAFLFHNDPYTLFNTTDKMQNPENYGE